MFYDIVITNNEERIMEKEKQVVSDERSVISKKEEKEAIKSKKNQEFGGRGGLDPSRYGDWEIAGKCVDF